MFLNWNIVLTNMKKEVILIGFFVLIFFLPSASAQLNLNETNIIKNKAISCIQDKVEKNGCSGFGLEDQIFSLLSTGQCKSDLLSKAQNQKCFGIQDCAIKITSQAVLALSASNSNIDSYKNWILSKSADAPGINWLLQIETPESSSCTLLDSEQNEYSVSIDDEKKLELSGSQDCLSLDDTGYWLEINPSCTNQEFEITCDKNFLANILFRKELSQTLYVLEESPESASAGGTAALKQKESLCFKDGNLCSYEGTLWAVLVLDKLKTDISSYLPYLIAFEEDNEALLPESFLYSLTDGQSFRSELLLKQKGNKYWDEAYDRYYDTAAALMSISNEPSEAKDNSLIWLKGIQGEDGCWDSGNIARTGFLLYSIWPTKATGAPVEDCEDFGNFCISDITCSEAGGEILDYSCPGFSVCCSEDEPSLTCEELQGEICDDTVQECDGSEDYTASDVGSGETCCIGSCKEKQAEIESECEQNFGVCRDYGCDPNEESLSFSCDFTYQSCCTVKAEKKGLGWLWALIILIILTALAIIFREKLKDFYFELKNKSKKGPRPPKTGAPMHRPAQQQRMPLRTIIPPRPHPTMPRRPMPPAQGRKKGDIDDVLKKLKEMGK